MRKLTHPTYSGTDRPILIGDHVIQPIGRNHEHGTYPYTVTEVSEKYVKLISEVNGRSESTYTTFVQPADEKSLARVTERLTADHIAQWKRDMARQDVCVLVIQNPHDTHKTHSHLIRLPKETTLAQMRVQDVVTPFVGQAKAKDYDRDDIYVREVDSVSEPYELDALVDSNVTTIDATPMTPLEHAFEAMDRIDRQSCGETTDDMRIIENAITELATRLDIELPERDLAVDDDLDDWYADWDD